MTAVVESEFEAAPRIFGFGLQLSGNPTYPANLCPLFLCAEFACNGEDLGEAVGDALKTAARGAVWQGSPKHLEQVLSGQQGVHYSFQAGAGRGDLCFRLRGEMARFRSGRMKFAL